MPAKSLAVHITVVVPTGNVDGALLVTEVTPQLSDVLGVFNVTVAEHNPGLLFTVKSAGQVITGISLSITVTCCVQVVVWL